MRDTINRWVEQQTNDKIQNLIAPGVLTPATRLVLTNAIYFKGTWRNQFEKAATAGRASFTSPPSQSVNRPLMHRTGSYPYYDGGTFQALELPYKGDELSMVVLLPKDTDGLPALEQSFTAAAADQWLQNSHRSTKSSSLSRASP